MSYAAQRAEAYAEATLEGRTLPLHDLARKGHEIALQSKTSEPMSADDIALAGQEMEAAITADMEMLKSWLAMAFMIGFNAGTEQTGRRLK